MRPTISFRWHWLAYAALSTTAALLSLAYYWAFWPHDIFHLNRPLRIMNPSVITGQGVLQYEMDYCKAESYGDVHEVVQHAFVDHLIQMTPQKDGLLPVGCHVMTVALEMPPLPPGKYHLEMTREYYVSPLHRPIIATARSQDFWVRGK